MGGCVWQACRLSRAQTRAAKRRQAFHSRIVERGHGALSDRRLQS